MPVQMRVTPGTIDVASSVEMEAFPSQLASLHQIEIDEDEIDFEPYSAFMPSEEVTIWIRAWTNNPALDGKEYLVFGQDGTGGYAAFWLQREGKPLLEQPIVFFGSEGEVGVVATCFADYCWLLAGGVGPYEAVGYENCEGKPNAAFTAFANKNAKAAKKSADDVMKAAKAEFPTFEAGIRSLCK